MKIDLSPRRLQVAKLSALNRSNKQIAAELGISIHTVNNTMQMVFRQLGIPDRHTLAFLFLAKGLIENPLK